jgi:hypothetical protein
MAIPIVNHIIPFGSSVGDPAEGPTAGRNLVQIYGRNFRLPPDNPSSGPLGPSNSGIVVADKQQTVSVIFGGEEALEVKVISHIRLDVIVPISPIAAVQASNYGEGDVDVIITNLDDDGDPIVGETVTVTDGYKYRRPKLDATNSTDLLRLVQTLIHELKRQVLPEVVLTVHTDFDADTSDQLNITELAKLPAIVLNGPDTPENRFYSLNERPEVIIDGEVGEIRRKPRTVDLLFDIIVVSDSTMELLNLEEIMNDFVNRNICLSMYRDPDDISKGKVEYEFGFQTGGEFSITTKPSTSNIRSFTGAVVIRGFDIEGISSFTDEAVRSSSRVLLEDVALDINKIEG